MNSNHTSLISSSEATIRLAGTMLQHARKAANEAGQYYAISVMLGCWGPTKIQKRHALCFATSAKRRRAGLESARLTESIQYSPHVRAPAWFKWFRDLGLGGRSHQCLGLENWVRRVTWDDMGTEAVEAQASYLVLCQRLGVQDLQVL